VSALGLAPAVAATNTVTLTLFEASDNPPFANQITAFEKAYPNVHVSVSSTPYGEMLTKEQTLVASGNTPDLLALDQPTIAYFAAAGALLPLNNYLPKGYIASLTSGARQDLSYNGKIYSSGPMDTALALFYNETYVSKAHISPPKSVAQGWTWPQAVSAMKACMKANPGVDGMAPSYFGNGTPGMPYYSSLFLRSEGSPNAPAGSPSRNTFLSISPNGKTVNGYINTPQAIAGATFYQNMFLQKVTPTVGDPTAFVDGKACFEMNTSNAIASYIHGHSGLGSGVTVEHLPFGVGITPWPYFTAKIVHNGTISITISAKTKHLQYAVDFVNYMSTDAAQTEEADNQGYDPVTKKLFKTIPGLQSYPWSIFSDELADYAYPRTVTPDYTEFYNLLYDAMRNIAYGSNVKSQLDQAASSIDHFLSTPTP
jgi:ABC-type glycerol-3-phosphate transport system substrate-binding protein